MLGHFAVLLLLLFCFHKKLLGFFWFWPWIATSHNVWLCFANNTHTFNHLYLPICPDAKTTTVLLFLFQHVEKAALRMSVRGPLCAKHSLRSLPDMLSCSQDGCVIFPHPPPISLHRASSISDCCQVRRARCAALSPVT